MTQSAAPTSLPPVEQADPHAAYNKGRLFFVSVLALTTMGIAFSFRAGLTTTLEKQFMAPLNHAKSAELIGWALGSYFLGFAFTIAIGSPLLDYLGMGRLLGLSSLCIIGGTCAAIFTEHFGVHRVDWLLWGAMLLTGVGGGLVETVINPLAATLYPNDKTHKLNVLHAWWPGGIVIGGLLDLAAPKLHLNWQWELAIIVIPAAVYGLLLIGAKFPPTERVAAGVSARDMVKEVLKPFFIVWFCCMFLTAASELAPQQWVEKSLPLILNVDKAIWVVIYVASIMFVMRHFAGPIAHKLSPVGLLWLSCLLASAGLLLLSMARSPAMAILAASVWGVGVCFMWPTMLAAASERFPRGGALLMGLMGTAGTLSIAFVLPAMGKVFDHYKDKGSLSAANAKANDIVAAAMSFRVVAILPAILLLVFGAIWFYDKSKGGYAAVRAEAAKELERAPV